jgi:hypothetical protein
MSIHRAVLLNALLRRQASREFQPCLFASPFFSRRQDRELLGAISRGLLDCPQSLRFIASATVLAKCVFICFHLSASVDSFRAILPMKTAVS